MKMSSIFKKASIFAIAVTMVLLMVVSVLPAVFAADATESTGFGEKLDATNISVAGGITMQYYFKGVDDAEGVQVTYPNESGNPITHTYAKEDLTKDSKGRYLVEIPIAFAQQTETLTIQWKKNGALGKKFEKKARDYADLIFKYAKLDPTDSKYAATIANAKAMVPMVTYMLNAGAQAQIQNNYKGGKDGELPLANEGLFAAESNPIDNMLADHFYDVDKRDEYDTAGTGVTFTGTNIFLQSKVNLRVYLACPDSITTAKVYRGEEYQEVYIKTETKDGVVRKYVGINNIVPTDFNVRFLFEVGDAKFEYSVLDYAYNAVKSPFATQEMKDTAKSLYLFYTYTREYDSPKDEETGKPTYVVGPKEKDNEGKIVVNEATGMPQAATKVDESGNTVIVCDHTRAYSNGTTIVCPDCGYTYEKQVVQILASASTDKDYPIVKGGTGKLTLTYAIAGNTDFTGLLIAPDLPDDITWSVDSYEFHGINGEVAQGAIGLNCEIDTKGPFSTGKLVTVVYTINATKATAGTNQITFRLVQATDGAGGLVDEETLAGVLTTTVYFDVLPQECAEDDHTYKYVIDGEYHYSLCSKCYDYTANVKHSYVTNTEKIGNKLVYSYGACECGAVQEGGRSYAYDLGFTLDADGNKVEKAPLLVFTPSDIKNMGTTKVDKGDITTTAEGSYISLHDSATVGEAWIDVFKGKDNPYGVTGQYLMIKYRTTHNANMEIFCGANNGGTSAKGGTNFTLPVGKQSLVANGEWQTLILDLSKIESDGFKAETTGDNIDKYMADYIRWDVFDSNPEGSEQTVDVAYIAMSDDIMSLASFAGNDIYTVSQSIETVTVTNTSTGKTSTYYHAVGAYMASAKTLNPFFDASWINQSYNHSSNVNIAEAVDKTNGGLHYAEITRKSSDTGTDRYMFLMGSVDDKSGNYGSGQIAPTVNAKYVAIMYRKHVNTGTGASNRFQVLLNSNGKTATATGTVSIQGSSNFKVDKQWHFAVADISGATAFNSSIGLQSLRFDFHEAPIVDSDTNLTDVAFIALFSSEEEAYEYMSEYVKNYLEVEGAQGCKHDAGARNAEDCYVYCEYCGAKTDNMAHVASDTWTTISYDPQNQASPCKDCGAPVTRATDTTFKGLTFFTPEEISKCGTANISDKTLVTENGLTFYRVVSKDGSEGRITINSGTSAIFGVGRYMAMMLRKTTKDATTITKGSVQVYANKTVGNSNTTGCVSPSKSLYASTAGEWTVRVFDFGEGYLTNETGVFWNRVDIFDGTKVAGDIVDIAWMGFFDSPADAYEMFEAYSQAYNACSHHDASQLTNIKNIEEENSIYTATADCTACGAKNVKVDLETIEDIRIFTAGKLLEQYKNTVSDVLSGTSFKLVVDDASVNNMPYVRYTLHGASEKLLGINDGKTNLTAGNYAAVLYRRNTAGDSTNTDYFQFYVNTVGTTDHIGAACLKSSEQAMNGEWVLDIFDVKSSGKLSENGESGWTRLDLFSNNYAEGNVVDIAYLAFFDTKEEAQNYYYEYIREFLGEENCPHSSETRLEATDSLTTYNKVCTICGGIRETLTNVNQEGLHVITPEALGGMFDTTSFPDELKDDAAHGDMPYLHITSTVEQLTGEKTVYLDFSSKPTNVGKIVTVLYRSNNMSIDQMWASESGLQGSDYTTKHDWKRNASEWTLATYDFTNAADKSWLDNSLLAKMRLDIENCITKSSSMDIAYIAFFDSVEDADAFYATYAEAYGLCPAHHANTTQVFPENSIIPNIICDDCGEDLGVVIPTENETGNLILNAATLPQHISSLKSHKDDGDKTFANAYGGMIDPATGLSFSRIATKMDLTKEAYIYMSFNSLKNVGKTVVVVYRANNFKANQMYASSGGISSNEQCVWATWNEDASDWTVATFNFNSAKNATWAEGEGLKMIRWDLENAPATGAYVDVAYIGFFASAEDADEFCKDFTTRFGGCPSNHSKTYTDKNDRCAVKCYFCNAVVEGATPQHDEARYEGTANPLICNKFCKYCGASMGTETGVTQEGLHIFTPDALIVDGVTNNATDFPRKLITDAAYNNMPYVHFTSTISATGEQFITIKPTPQATNVGPIVAILYRSSNMLVNQIFASETGLSGKDFTDTHNWKRNASEWTLATFDFTNTTDVSWLDNSKLYQMRLDVEGGVNTSSNMDIAYIAFFNTKEEANEFYLRYSEYYGFCSIQHKETYVDTNDNCAVKCKGCDKLMSDIPAHTHSGKTTVTEVNGVTTYSSICSECGGTISKLSADAGKAPNVVITAPDIVNSYNGCADWMKKLTGSVTIQQDSDGTEFARITGNGSRDPYFYFYTNANGDVETGRYLTIKYRLPNNGLGQTSFEIYASTTNGSMLSGDNKQLFVISEKDDGEWYTLVVDLSKIGSTFKASETDDKYYAKYIRLDLFDSVTPTAEHYVDVQFVSISNDLTDFVYTGNSKFSENTSYYDSTTGTVHDFDQFNGLMSWLGDEKLGGQYIVTDANGITYNKYISKHSSEQNITLYSNATALKPVSNYIAVIYRAPKTVTFCGNSINNKVGPCEIYVHSTKTGAQGGCSKSANYTMDGTWKVMILDFTSIAAYDPATGLTNLRLDFFNTTTPGAELHIAAISFVESKDAGTAWYNEFVNAYYPDGQTEYVPSLDDCENGQHANIHGFTPADPVDGVLREEKLCTFCGAIMTEARNVWYRGYFNYISFNGTQVATKQNAYYNSAAYSLAGKGTANTVTVSGWMGTESGVKAYYYRVNGGNWIKITSQTLGTANSDIVNAINSQNMGIVNFNVKGASFTITTGDLATNYAGQVVTLEFGFCPNNQPGTDAAPNVISFKTFTNVQVADAAQ